ncbi:MAG: hypothetical protein ACRDBO_01855 [Lachnospiraceae bacterium]
MTNIAVSFIGYTFKVICFAVIAYAGIICGKKFKDKKDAQNAIEQKESR